MGIFVYKQGTQRKVVVDDSLYSNTIFLSALLTLTMVVALVRLRRNHVLYKDAPAPAEK